MPYVEDFLAVTKEKHPGIRRSAARRKTWRKGAR